MSTLPLAETGRHPLTVALPQPRTPDADNGSSVKSQSETAGQEPERLPLANPRAVEILLTGPAPAAGRWQDRALCAQTDPEAFFPEKGGSTREAKRICTGCDVRSECLASALANDERFGIWGGLSERERRRLRRIRG